MAKVKHHDFTKPPIKGDVILYSIVWMLTLPSMKWHKLKINKEGMEGLKPPYLLLCNHQSFYDLRLMQRAIFPRRANYVAAIDAFALHNQYIMRGLGCIAKRKFLAMDLSLIRNMKYSLNKLKNICVLYPEARFTLDGKRSYIPQSVGKLCKTLGVPVVTLNMHGCFVANPQFSQKKYKHVPFRAEMKHAVTKEELSTLSAEQINERLIANLTYDEYDYQKENNIRIKDKNRARGLGSLLYQCPACKAEHVMTASGTILRCGSCGKAYEYTELGEMRALAGETEFSHIPDWFDWQRENVRREVEAGTYRFEDEVDVHTLPNGKRYYKHGKGKVVHTVDGFTLSCNAYGKETKEHWRPEETYGCHIEYNFRKKGDVLDISKVDESYWLYPTKKNVITKISIAFEEIYKLKTKGEILR
ncbi:MAG: 1-acyl-sn-glycerol-3-phosphate acyltransferase [Clostridiales bacterium]|nr:1-acyl-sn-glycerol-3-phosphate acyltransferase [Clostridiales bacterium]